MTRNRRPLGGIILLGGKSKRMGADKYLLPFFHSTLIEKLAGELKSSVNELLLVTREPAKIQHLSLRTAIDIFDEPCALTGIHAGLVYSEYQYNFILACDLPLFSSALVPLMFDRMDDTTTAMVPRTKSGLETLCGIYTKDCIPEIERLLEQKNYSVQALYSRVETKIVDAQELETKTHEHVFFNMNTPADYEKALSLAARLNTAVSDRQQ